MKDLDHRDPERVSRESGRPIHAGALSNALQLSRDFRSFKKPEESKVRRLKPGDFVKLARNQERFWVQVSGFIGRRWHGTIVNRLERNPDIGLGQSIFFMKKNIYDLRSKA